MNKKNTINFVKNSGTHIININRDLKNIKLDIMADFICIENKRVVITTNKVASTLDLQIIEKYIKSSQYIEVDYMESSRLPQSKFYLKIISIPYLSEQTNIWVISEDIEKILKNTHIFNDVVPVSKLRIIKVSPKSDMAIVWIDIWDAQSGTKVKTLINKRFNISSFIATIHDANINPGVLQCKNCWKWGHMHGVCRIQDAKCIKCNDPYQTIHYHQFA